MTSLASKETAFEASIAKYLASHGWLTASPKGFDREQLLHPDEFLAFVEATQANELAKLAKTAGGGQAARTSLSRGWCRSSRPTAPCRSSDVASRTAAFSSRPPSSDRRTA